MQNSVKIRRHKEEPNGIFRTEKCNLQNKNLSAWAGQQNGEQRGRIIRKFE